MRPTTVMPGEAFQEDSACVVTNALLCRPQSTRRTIFLIFFFKVRMCASASPVSQLSSREKQEERASSSSLSSVKLSSPFSSRSSFSSARPVRVGESRSLVGAGCVCSSLYGGPTRNVKNNKAHTLFRLHFAHVQHYLTHFTFCTKCAASVLPVFSKIINKHQLSAAGLFEASK